MKIDKIQKMFDGLKTISNYQTVTQLQKNAGKDYGLDYTEALEMAYENVLYTAKLTVKGLRRPANPPKD